MDFPRAFTIAPTKPDYSLLARTFAYEVKIRFRINAVIDAGNANRLTGWHKAATKKLTFFVSNPESDEVARESIREAARHLNKTTELLMQVEDYMLPLMTGIPIGFEIVDTPVRVDRKQPRDVAFLWDFIAEIRDNWRRTYEARLEEVANYKPAAAA